MKLHSLTHDDGVLVLSLKVIWKHSIFKELVGSFLIFYELVAGVIFKKIKHLSFKASKYFQIYHTGNLVTTDFM